MIKKDSNLILFENLQRELKGENTFQLILQDFTKTFFRLGCGNEDKVTSIALFLIVQILRSKNITTAEKQIKNFFNNTKFEKNKTVFDLISEGLKGRIEIIFNQIRPYLESVIR